jgi:hypothetical protein
MCNSPGLIGQSHGLIRVAGCYGIPQRVIGETPTKVSEPIGLTDASFDLRLGPERPPFRNTEVTYQRVLQDCLFGTPT